MKIDLSIIIAHYKPENFEFSNPLFKTLDIIKEQIENFNIEVIIADDGSHYSKEIIDGYSKKETVTNDNRNFYIWNNKELNEWIKKNEFSSNLISHWTYLPKTNPPAMSKSRILNYAVTLSNSENLLFLDDDNYFISNNSIENIINLFKVYNLIIGQIKDNNGKFRKYNSNRVQGTTIAVKKNIIEDINGFGEWTEEFSCGVDSDLWIKLFKYFNKDKNLKACYTNQLSTYDSYSKRWKKYTKLFKEIKLRKKFNKLYNCKNYKNYKYNFSRQKKMWIENLIDE